MLTLATLEQVDGKIKKANKGTSLIKKPNT